MKIKLLNYNNKKGTFFKSSLKNSNQNQQYLFKSNDFRCVTAFKLRKTRLFFYNFLYYPIRGF